MLESATREGLSPAGDEARTHADQSSDMLSSLLSISKTMRAFYGLKLFAAGFQNGQDELIVAIGDEVVSVGAMADLLSVRPSTVSKMLDRLIEKGLCERTHDRRDARKSFLQITPAGVEVRKQIIQLRREVEAELTRNLDADACTEMTRVLSDCAAYLDRQLRRVR